MFWGASVAISIAGFICGLVFGLGLVISGMAWPPKVLNFLDLLGAWDPSLLVVMAALLASAAGYALARRSPKPLLADECQWPNRTGIDRSLIAGATMFGIGWGLVGLCPGPALVNLATLSPQVIVFVLAMAAGMGGHDLWRKSRAKPIAVAEVAAADG
jgi:uncharacterized membrane protein YedE/YeeE